MRCIVFTLLLLSTTALAWEPGEVVHVEVPVVPAAVAVVEIEGLPALVGVGPEGSWVVRASGEKLSDSTQKGLDLAVVGDDVFVCDEYGLYHLAISAGRLGSARKVSSERCASVVAYTKGKGEKSEDWLMSATDLLGLWKIEDDRSLVGPHRFGLRLGGEPLLVSDGVRFGATGLGDTEIVERSEFGRSSVVASGPVGGLAIADGGLTWLLQGLDAVEDASRRVVEVAPKPTGLTGADVDGDDRVDLLVSHAGKLGLIAARASVEQTWPIPLKPSYTLAADVDADGCTDVVLLQQDVASLAILPGRCPGGVGEPLVSIGAPATLVTPFAPPPADPAPPELEPLEPTPSVAAAEQAPPARLVVRRMVWPTVELTAGQTWSARLDVRDGQPPFSFDGAPAGIVLDDGIVQFTPSGPGKHAVEVVSADDPERGFGGFFLEVAAAPAGAATPVPVGPAATPDPETDPSAESTYSGERQLVILGDGEPKVTLTAGREAHLQLALHDGAPERFEALGLPDTATLLPDGSLDWTPSSFEAGTYRATVRMTGGTERTRTEALWVDVRPDPSRPSPRVKADDVPSTGSGDRNPLRGLAPDDAGPSHPSDGAFRPSPWALRSCTLGLGAAAGASGTQNDWDFVGQGTIVSISMAFAGSCSGGGDKVRWMVGWDSAPQFFYLGVDPIGSHILGFTAGSEHGNDTFRVGPHLTAGANLLGIGGRLVWLPIAAPDGSRYGGVREPARRGRHGIELRMTLFFPSSPAAQTMLMYTHQFRSFVK